MRKVKLSKVLSALLLSSVCMLNATSLQEAVENTLVQNPELSAIYENNRAYNLYIEEAKGDYRPKIDFEVTGESRSTKSKLLNNSSQTESQDGYDAQLRIEQLIYDGGLTPAKIEEAKLRDQVNMFTNNAKVEGVLLNGVKAYLDLVKYTQRLELSSANLATHKSYLVTAKSTEEVSGDALDTYEVQAKLHLANKNYLDEVDNEQISQNSFKRITGSQLEGGVSMPVINLSVLPQHKDDLINKALSHNFTVLAQMAKIKEQRAIINQEKAKFLPTLKFNLTGTWDDDLITKDYEKEIYSAKIVLNYNFYTGGKDEASKTREDIFLKESTKILDSKTDLIVDEVTSSFTTFANVKHKITQLKGYVSTNQDILAIYKDQFEAGTRTFVDVLDIESDLYNAKVQLIDEEVKLLDTYYTMLALTSSLQDALTAQSSEEKKVEATK
ncbi:MAG: TolC family protein [Campylobacterota bacterium]|nr:TolC family protein [Campylobacterota bacterium]